MFRRMSSRRSDLSEPVGKCAEGSALRGSSPPRMAAAAISAFVFQRRAMVLT